MPFLKELKLKPNCPELVQNATLGPQNVKKKIWRRLPIPTRGLASSHSYPDLALRAEIGAPPHFLVPVITTIVLAISNLKENPVMSVELRPQRVCDHESRRF